MRGRRRRQGKIILRRPTSPRRHSRGRRGGFDGKATGDAAWSAMKSLGDRRLRIVAGKVLETEVIERAVTLVRILQDIAASPDSLDIVIVTGCGRYLLA